MNKRLTTSGVGRMRICAACSYDDRATKRRATYSSLSKLGSQYLLCAAARSFRFLFEWVNQIDMWKSEEKKKNARAMKRRGF